MTMLCIYNENTKLLLVFKGTCCIYLYIYTTILYGGMENKRWLELDKDNKLKFVPNKIKPYI